MLTLTGVVFLCYVAGAVLSILAKWPAHFGGAGDPANVAAEFLSRGTALAPMLVFGALALLARRRDRWGAGGIVGLMALAVLFIIGSRGEAFAPPPLTVPRAVLVASGVIGSVLSVALIVLGLLALSERRSPTRL